MTFAEMFFRVISLLMVFCGGVVFGRLLAEPTIAKLQRRIKDLHGPAFDSLKTKKKTTANDGDYRDEYHCIG